MRRLSIVMGMLLCPLGLAAAQVSVDLNVSIGIEVPAYPQLVLVPGYPVYYAPDMDSNYFFFDGMYWVCEGDNWYASSWYNGPWSLVAEDSVPDFILRVPVRYYRQPPTYFAGWQSDEPPRWGEHWGSGWERQHNGWDQWNRSAAFEPAPLPVYQKQYSGNRYPDAVHQQSLHSQNYQYQPRDARVQQAYKAQGVPAGSAPSQSAKKSTPDAQQQRGTPRTSSATKEVATTPSAPSVGSAPQRDTQRNSISPAKQVTATPSGQSAGNAQQRDTQRSSSSPAKPIAAAPSGQSAGNAQQGNTQRNNSPAKPTAAAPSEQSAGNAQQRNTQRNNSPARPTAAAPSEQSAGNAQQRNTQRSSSPAKQVAAAPSGQSAGNAQRGSQNTQRGGGQPTARAKTEEEPRR